MPSLVAATGLNFPHDRSSSEPEPELESTRTDGACVQLQVPFLARLCARAALGAMRGHWGDGEEGAWRQFGSALNARVDQLPSGKRRTASEPIADDIRIFACGLRSRECLCPKYGLGSINSVRLQFHS